MHLNLTGLNGAHLLSRVPFERVRAGKNTVLVSNSRIFVDNVQLSKRVASKPSLLPHTKTMSARTSQRSGAVSHPSTPTVPTTTPTSTKRAAMKLLPSAQWLYQSIHESNTLLFQELLAVACAVPATAHAAVATTTSSPNCTTVPLAHIVDFPILTYGGTPLFVSCEKGRTKIVRHLISQGTDGRTDGCTFPDMEEMYQLKALVMVTTATTFAFIL